MAGPAAAALLVLHGCAVTARSERKARQLLHRWQREQPGKRRIVTGCLARHWRTTGGGLAGVELATDGWPAAAGSAAARAPRRIRRTLKLQDGCTHRCAYCIVPQLRPTPWQLPAAAATATVRDWLAAGAKEIVISGLHLGSYRDGDRGLAAWLREAAALPGEFRIRLSSLEPESIPDDLLALLADHPEKLCPHLHLPVQSGSAAVLARMNRPYDRARLDELLARIHRRLPAAALTADFIVGFPGETDADFQATMELLAAMACARAHIFPFSPRPGTPAAAFDGRVPDPVIRERTRRLRQGVDREGERFRAGLVGRSQRLLVEKRDGSGYTETFQRLAAGRPLPVNTLVTVTVTGVTATGLIGAPIA